MSYVKRWPEGETSPREASRHCWERRILRHRKVFLSPRENSIEYPTGYSQTFGWRPMQRRYRRSFRQLDCLRPRLSPKRRRGFAIETAILLFERSTQVDIWLHRRHLTIVLILEKLERCRRQCNFSYMSFPQSRHPAEACKRIGLLMMS